MKEHIIREIERYTEAVGTNAQSSIEVADRFRATFFSGVQGLAQLIYQTSLHETVNNGFDIDTIGGKVELVKTMIGVGVDLPIHGLLMAHADAASKVLGDTHVQSIIQSNALRHDWMWH